MTKARSSIAVYPSIWLTTHDNYGRVGGSARWGTEGVLRMVEYLAGWPVLKLRLVKEHRRSRLQSAISD